VVVTKDAATIRYSNNTATSIANYLCSSVLGKRPELTRKGTKGAAAEAAAIATEAIAAAGFLETERLAAEFEVLGGGALTAEEAEANAKAAAPGNPLRECWLARERCSLVGTGMGSCIGVAHTNMLGAFQTAGGRRKAAKAAVRMQQRATGSSFHGMALDQADVDAKVADFQITSFFMLPKAERWKIIRHLQRCYQDGVVIASREALKAKAAARLARLR
jgi:hypothetical protein